MNGQAPRGSLPARDGRVTPRDERSWAPAFRYVVGLAWAFAVGLAGGWLMLTPWALGGQGSGDWASATKAQFWSGAALVVLALAGAVLVALDAAGQLRPANAARRPAEAAGEPVDDAELERALVRLADALATDLAAPAPPAPAPVVPMPPAVPVAPPGAPPAAGGPGGWPAPGERQP